MGTGIDADFRNQFLARLQATTRFWELAGLNHMFVRKDFHASIGSNQFDRPDEEERWPEPGEPYPYVSCLKGHEVVADMVCKYMQERPDSVYVFPVNLYAWGVRIDGPYKHPIEIIKTFTPRTSSNHWIHEWDYLNSGQCFFVGVDASWALYTRLSTKADSVDYLMADMPVLDRLTTAWPDIVKHIHREKPHKRPVRRERMAADG